MPAALADGVFGEARWIGATTQGDDTLADRSIVVGRDIRCRRQVRQAPHRVRTGCLRGVCRRQQVGSDLMAPAWSDYRKTVYYNNPTTSRRSWQGVSPPGGAAGQRLLPRARTAVP
jgi:hypothetical protein